MARLSMVEAQASGEEGASNDGMGTIAAQLRACAHSGDVERAESLVEVVGRRDPANLTVGMYNSVIHACVASNDPDRAESNFQRMRAYGLTPDVVTFNSLINAFASTGDAARAEEWLMVMMSSGVALGRIMSCRTVRRCTYVCDIARPAVRSHRRVARRFPNLSEFAPHAAYICPNPPSSGQIWLIPGRSGLSFLPKSVEIEPNLARV